jgi:hypothetical protein
MSIAAPNRPAPGLDPRVALQLPADAYYHLVRTLCLTLPPPPSDSPDALAQRNHAAITRIAALVPANAAEADVAALYVAASEQWKDCLRLVQLPETTPERALKCRAQALSMMRQAERALRLLLKLQEAREKREANSAGCNSAAWTEHCALGLMAEALSPQPMPAAVAQPPAPPPAPAPLPEPEPMMDPKPDPIAEAEQYAAIYPERAALIRRIGRVPADASFGPPDDDLVQALIAARTPALAALDREFAQACPVPRHGACAA